MMKVSVIMPIYNAERYLRNTLDSICTQDYPNVEFIAVDDASTDESPLILEEYRSVFERKGYKYVIIRSPINGGLCAAINEGLKVYTGEYLCFPDADDYLMPNYISAMVYTLQSEPSKNWVRCNYITVLTDENREYTVNLPKQSVYKNDFYDFISKLVPHNAWNMLVSSAYFKKVVGAQIFNTRLTQEWSMLLPLSYHSDYARCDAVLYRYNIRKDAMSSWINSDINSVIRHIDELHSLNLVILSSLGVSASERFILEHALSIYYTYLKYSKYELYGLHKEALHLHKQLLELTKDNVKPDFALSVDNPELLTRFALDSVLNMRADKPCQMYQCCNDLLSDGYICIVDKRGNSLIPAVRTAFGDPHEVIELSEISSSKQTAKDEARYGQTPVLLLIENSKIAGEVAQIYCGLSTRQLIDYRYLRDALRGWAYMKGWK